MALRFKCENSSSKSHDFDLWRLNIVEFWASLSNSIGDASARRWFEHERTRKIENRLLYTFIQWQSKAFYSSLNGLTGICSDLHVARLRPETRETKERVDISRILGEQNTIKRRDKKREKIEQRNQWTTPVNHVCYEKNVLLFFREFEVTMNFLRSFDESSNYRRLDHFRLSRVYNPSLYEKLG